MDFILGGTGLIGGALANALRARGRPIGIFSRGNIKNKNFYNDCTFIQGIPGESNFKSALLGCDSLFLCNFLYNNQYNFNLEEYFEQIATDLQGKCLKNITLISSASVYVDGEEEGPASELTSTRPITEYGKFKLKEEEMAINFLSKNSKNLYIIRPASVFGRTPADKFSRGIVDTILYSVKSKNTFILKASRESVRDYIRSDYLAEAILKIMDRNSGGIFNIGGDPVSTNEILNLSHLIFEENIKIEEDFDSSFTGTKFILNSNKTKSLLGRIQPKPSLDLIEDYFRENFK